MHSLHFLRHCIKHRDTDESVIFLAFILATVAEIKAVSARKAPSGEVESANTSITAPGRTKKPVAFTAVVARCRGECHVARITLLHIVLGFGTSDAYVLNIAYHHAFKRDAAIVSRVTARPANRTPASAGEETLLFEKGCIDLSQPVRFYAHGMIIQPKSLEIRNIIFAPKTENMPVNKDFLVNLTLEAIRVEYDT
jgi:hypothetical protein